MLKAISKLSGDTICVGTRQQITAYCKRHAIPRAAYKVVKAS